MANAGPVYDPEDERTAKLNKAAADEVTKRYEQARANSQEGAEQEEADAQDDAENEADAEEEKSLADQEADEALREIMDDDDLSLAEKEALVYIDKVGRGYVDKPRQLGFVRRQLGKRNRIFLIGGSVFGAVVIALAIFLTLLPFKILHIVNNLESHFFATSENAVQKEDNVLFSNYIKASFKQCRNGTIDRNCNPIQGNSLVAQLYKGWRNARLEDQLAKNQHLEFKVGKSGHFYVHVNGMDGDGFDLGDENSGFTTGNESLDEYITNSRDDRQFKKVSRAELRATINTALTEGTNSKGVLYRYKVGRFMEKKYGLKRCLFVCDTRDNFADWKDNKFRAGKMIIAERVLAPRSETVALIVQCVLSDSCDPSQNNATDKDGRKVSGIQLQVQTRLAALAAEDTGRYADILVHSNGILQDGYAKYLAKKVAVGIVSKAGAKEATQQTTEKIAGNAIPIFGWANTALSTVHTLKNGAKAAKGLNYITNASAMAALYGTYRVYADECKTGHCDAQIAGAMSDTLSAGNKDSAGGIATAEQSPLYGSLIDNDPGAPTVALGDLIGGQANAASNDPPYTCKNHKPPDPGEWVCEEEVLGGNNSALVKSLGTISASLGPLNDIADLWYNTIGSIARAAIGTACKVTCGIVSSFIDLTHLNDLISKVSGPLVSAFTDLLIQNPFSDNMGGGRTFDLTAGGADVAAQGFAQETLGAKKISPVQASAIRQEQTQQDWLAYKNQSLVSRLFDKNSNYSVATKLAMAVPDNTKIASSNLTTALLTNPFSKLANVFSPIFGITKARAATPVNDPFGVPQYGYPTNDPTLIEANKDPEAYWENNCTSDGTTIDWTKPVNANWQNNTTTDPDTGLPEYDTTDPCLLIQAAVGAAGAKYDDGLLTKDDLGVSAP